MTDTRPASTSQVIILGAIFQNAFFLELRFYIFSLFFFISSFITSSYDAIPTLHCT